ncbi:MAG: glycosyltransferase [Actinomycetota bacterium]|nr:glycosyltransferase [Actinomycetota bacterium]
MNAPAPSLRYVATLTDEHGIFEHALECEPRRQGGYCTDDAGRLLALASRMGEDPDAARLARVSLSFLERAHVARGHFRLRLLGEGRWSEDAPSDDAAGRALLGLGTAAALAPWPAVRTGARTLFEEAASTRSAHPRALAYAALGARVVLEADPRSDAARTLVSRARGLLDNGPATGTWPWPEPRLTYANALLPEAALAAARLAGDADGEARALDVLWWLVQRQTRENHFSFVSVRGSAGESARAQFDQQPIEACAMASACARAYWSTREDRWAQAVQRAAAWFLGENDASVAMFDAESGGGYDGLQRHGVNRNEGAESSMAFVETMLTWRDVRRDWGEDSA